LNQRGHTSHNWSKYRIHPDISAAFFEGLNEADSMLHAVNVGQSKEAADVKLKGESRVLLFSVLRELMATTQLV
jgi:hypothetical protein